MVVLIETLGTRTVMEIHELKVVAIIQECVQTGDILDITDAGLVPKIARLIMSSINTRGLKVVDHKSEVRRTRIAVTEERRNREKSVEDLPREPLPILTETGMLSIYLKSLQLNKVYTFDFISLPEDQKDMMLGLVIVLVLTRPKINLDLSAAGTHSALFTRISTGICARRKRLMIQTFDEFYFVSKTEFIVEKVSVRKLDEVFDFQGAPSTWNQLLSKYNVVPTFFGTGKLKSVSDDMDKAERERTETILDIFSSVDGAAQGSIVKHFENKNKRATTLIEFVKETGKNAL